jgi:tol-pal system protein YbgF
VPTYAPRLLLLTSLAAGACGGAQQRDADDAQRRAIELAELRAAARADRRKIVDLEHRLALAAVAPHEPELVQRAPTATPPPAEPPAAEPMTSAGVVYGDGDVEIVYEGEAAEPAAARPQLTLHERRGGADLDDLPVVELDAVPAVGDELPVVRGELPTVDAQLRRARSAPLRATSRPVPVGDANGDYQRCYAALRTGNHAYAVTGFRNFLARYPDHDFADNAQYWLGESFYDQKDYATAAAEFRRVLERYPRGNKVADALLKLGFSEIALGKRDDGRRTLERVVAQHPKTASAALASERLGTLGRTP